MLNNQEPSQPAGCVDDSNRGSVSIRKVNYQRFWHALIGYAQKDQASQSACLLFQYR